jgi:hypothetical protein
LLTGGFDAARCDREQGAPTARHSERLRVALDSSIRNAA